MLLKITPFKTLFAVYAVAISIGLCEYFFSARQRTERDIYGEPQHNFAAAVAHLYPASAEAEYELGRDFEAKAGRGFNQELLQRDPEALRKFLASMNEDLKHAAAHYERAIDWGLKSEESLFYNYALTLMRIEAPSESIDRAVAAWRKNFPFSSRRDLDERRKLIAKQLRLLPTVSLPTVSSKSTSVAPAHFDSVKEIASAIAATAMRPDSSPQWKANPGFLGSEACRQCHPAEFASHAATPHSRALAPVQADQEPLDVVFDHDASGRRFRVARHDGQLFHSESLLLDDNTEFPLTSMPLSQRVGSGQFARTYLVEVLEGFFVESPVTWYESTKSWGMSPGFDRPGHRSFSRPVLENCLQCHCGQVQTSLTNQMQLRVVENAIGCERCHGPGEAHVAARQANRDLSQFEIINPNRLSRRLSEAICEQCHLQGDIHIGGRNFRAPDFRPGQPLEEYSTVYRLGSLNDSMTVVGHVEQLGQSECYQRSDKLTCVTCHDSHQPVAPEERPDHFRKVCLTCHQPEDCHSQADNAAENANQNCVQCHMPKSRTEVPHVAFTHHRIGVDLPRNRSPQKKSASRDEADDSPIPLSELSSLGDFDRLRSLMLARIQSLLLRGTQYIRTVHGQKHKVAIEDWLKNVTQSDAEIEFAQIQFLLACGDQTQAEALALNLLRDQRLRSEEVAALQQQLGELSLRRNRFDAAQGHFEKLVHIRINGHDRYQLGFIGLRTGSTQAATPQLEVARRLLPADLRVYESLAKAMRSQGNPSARAIEAQMERILHMKRN